MSRRSPRRHPVRGHTRDGGDISVPDYYRGSGYPYTPSRVVKPPVSLEETLMPEETPETGGVYPIAPQTDLSEKGLEHFLKLQEVENMIKFGEEIEDPEELRKIARDAYEYCLDHREKMIPEKMFPETVLTREEISNIENASHEIAQGISYEEPERILKNIPEIQLGIEKICMDYWRRT